MPSSPIERLDRIVLVHRLREVVAQVGFTRFEPSYAKIKVKAYLFPSIQQRFSRGEATPTTHGKKLKLS
jgi:hypothetical protein